jgi:hypothetical protein
MPSLNNPLVTSRFNNVPGLNDINISMMMNTFCMCSNNPQSFDTTNQNQKAEEYMRQFSKMMNNYFPPFTM